MDLTSVVGVPLGVGLILLGQILDGGTARSLLQVSAAVIVFGGTLGAVLVSFPLSDVMQAVRSLRLVFTRGGDAAQTVITDILRYAKIARKDGMLAL